MVGPVHILLIILVSLCLGSFLNVVIHRLPRGESLIAPGSRCPSCAKPIRFFDNIPLFGFLFLNGKCRSCHAPISWRYPIVEALTALVILALFAVYGPTVPFLAYSILMLFLIPISIIDLDTGFIPDKLVIPAAVLGIFFLFAFHVSNWKVTWSSGLLGAVSGGALLVVFMVLGKLLFKKEAMGMGDVKLLAMTGIYVGFPAVWISLFIGGCIAFLVIIGGLILKRIRLQSAIPFGPFIALGILTYLLGGESIVRWYLGFTS